MHESSQQMLRQESSRRIFIHGLRDGLPIGLGYLAVSFSLGIAAKKIGLTPFQGFLASLTTVASAGQYAGWTVIAESAPYIMMMLTTLVASARYLLMSVALSQRFSPKTKLPHRLLVGYAITDEIFGITIARPGYVDPFYSYGAMVSSIPFWAVGTSLGIIMGNVLPLRVVSALSVSLYAMFLAIIIPPARKSRVVACLVVISFAASFAAAKIPAFAGISSGMKIIVLTVVISAIAALLFPVRHGHGSGPDEDETGPDDRGPAAKEKVRAMEEGGDLS